MPGNHQPTHGSDIKNRPQGGIQQPAEATSAGQPAEAALPGSHEGGDPQGAIGQPDAAADAQTRQVATPEMKRAMDYCGKMLKEFGIPYKITDQLIHRKNPPHDDIEVPSLEVQGDADMLISILVAEAIDNSDEMAIHVNVGDKWRGIYGLSLALADYKTAAAWAVGVWSGWQMCKAGFRNTNVMNIDERLRHLVDEKEQQEFEAHYKAETERQKAEKAKA